MNVYTKVLIELAKSTSIQARYNSLIKIYYSTEDCKLKDLIHKYSDYLLSANDKILKSCYSACESILTESEPAKTALIDYCNEVKMSGKLEWQVLAERYGWKPPK